MLTNSLLLAGSETRESGTTLGSEVGCIGSPETSQSDHKVLQRIAIKPGEGTRAGKSHMTFK